MKTITSKRIVRGTAVVVDAAVGGKKKRIVVLNAGKGGEGRGEGQMLLRASAEHTATGSVVLEDSNADQAWKSMQSKMWK